MALYAFGRFDQGKRKFDDPIHLLDTVTGKEIQSLSGHEDGVFAGGFSPDHKLLVSTGNDGIRLWDVQTGKEIRCLQRTQAPYKSVVFSPNGKLLASGTLNKDKTVSLWEVAPGKESGIGKANVAVRT